MVTIWRRGSRKSEFWQGKGMSELIANFSATTVISLPVFLCTVCLYVCLSCCKTLLVDVTYFLGFDHDFCQASLDAGYAIHKAFNDWRQTNDWSGVSAPATSYHSQVWYWCAKFKEVRGSFAILFWLPCATWHCVMTHTHHTQLFRSTDAFLRLSTPGPISEVSWGFHLHPSGLSFGFQARCTGSTRTNKRHRFQKSSVIDRLNDAWKRGMDQEETSTTSIDRRAGEWVHGRSSEQLLSFSAVVSVIFLFFCAGGPGEWAVVRLLRSRWTPAQDPCWSRQRLLDVDLVSVFTISYCSQHFSQHFFGSVVLQSSFSLSCTNALGEWSVVSHRWSRRTPAGFCIWK